MNLIERYPPDIKEHVTRVAISAITYGNDYETVALLHDILEDTETTEDELPEEYREDIITLTRKDTETYFDYIERVSRGSKRAITIKLLDIEDHLNNKETLKTSLEKRYLKAKNILMK
jgi:(p)ppGpp synthase/HD superfamily hydrolase